ncbi:hypothetical protein [Mycobacteroides abscessus]|uniref:hypothetical protein n=1 Tax=Mycobacteroides abscessus TaxID=36809 RepID=UPI001785B4DF|nr:hypothetical protein [Mycobacteroides abscessus]QOF30197.1 hypothetical protein E3G43_003762 [Mycobacteroides abscessus]
MADTFDADPETLPPVTKAFRLAWVKANPGNWGPITPSYELRAALDAVHSLEQRIAALETP